VLKEFLDRGNAARVVPYHEREKNKKKMPRVAVGIGGARPMPRVALGVLADTVSVP
jgi:hypothetical protein